MRLWVWMPPIALMQSFPETQELCCRHRGINPGSGKLHSPESIMQFSLCSQPSPETEACQWKKALTTDAELWQVAGDARKVTGKEVGRSTDDRGSFGTALQDYYSKTFLNISAVQSRWVRTYLQEKSIFGTTAQVASYTFKVGINTA